MTQPIKIEINLENIGSEIVVQAQAIGAIINALRNHDPALGRAIGMHLRSAAAKIDKEPVTGRLLDLADVAEFETIAAGRGLSISRQLDQQGGLRVNDKLIEAGDVKLDPMGSVQSLRCPRCGGNNLHQERVTVYDRDEDDDVTTVTEVQDGMVASHLRPSSRANPSSRRHGLTISFWCEGCTNKYPKPVIQLCIAQHKGDTFVSWRFTPIEAPQV